MLRFDSRAWVTVQCSFCSLSAVLSEAVAWLCSLGLSLPLVVPNGVDIEGNSQRYLCTVDGEAAAAFVWVGAMVGSAWVGAVVGFVWVGAVVGCVCPVSVAVVMFVGTVASATTQRRKLAASRAYANTPGSATLGTQSDGLH